MNSVCSSRNRLVFAIFGKKTIYMVVNDPPVDMVLMLDLLFIWCSACVSLVAFFG